MRLLITPPQDSYVSISGGQDSISAALILKKKFGIIRAYHFNHGTVQAGDMEESTRRFCRDFDFELKILDGKDLDSEDSMRKARIGGFFDKIGGNLVTAHHLNDAVESYALNFLRGHGQFLPIPVKSNFQTGSIYHPFLLVTKERLANNKLKNYVVEDKSNKVSTGCRRNWIRNELIPMIEGQRIGLQKIVRKKYLDILRVSS